MDTSGGTVTKQQQKREILAARRRIERMSALERWMTSFNDPNLYNKARQSYWDEDPRGFQSWRDQYGVVGLEELYEAEQRKGSGAGKGVGDWLETWFGSGSTEPAPPVPVEAGGGQTPAEQAPAVPLPRGGSPLSILDERYPRVR